MMRKKINFIFCAVLLTVEISTAQQARDSVAVAASNRYQHPSLFKRVFLGKNYRKEWSIPVMMPVFDIRDAEHGFKIEELGGDHQTVSLRLKDKRDRDWALRSVDKNVDKVIKRAVLKIFAKGIVQDMVSSAYPYGSLSVTELAKSSGVLTGKEQLFFVPDDPALGKYRAAMANRVCILVERQPIAGDEMKTEEIGRKLKQSNRYKIDQEKLLKARLLDWLIADWDRDSSQLRWMQYDSAGLKWIYPLPRDRDQAFAYADGLLVKTAGIFIPWLKGFKNNMSGLKALSKSARDMDIAYLNELDKDQWLNIVRDFEKNISDTAIQRAVNRQPKEVVLIGGKKMAGKLAARRDDMRKHAMKYYSFLSRKVTVTGSDEAEIFKVTNRNGKINVAVYDAEGKNSSSKLYERNFDAGETAVIYLEGLSGSDHFQLEGENTQIKIIFRGGAGKDVYSFAASSKLVIEDGQEADGSINN